LRVGVAVREWTSPTLRDTRRLSGFVTRARKFGVALEAAIKALIRPHLPD
jgi:hypothetical protein